MCSSVARARSLGVTIAERLHQVGVFQDRLPTTDIDIVQAAPRHPRPQALNDLSGDVATGDLPDEPVQLVVDPSSLAGIGTTDGFVEGDVQLIQLLDLRVGDPLRCAQRQQALEQLAQFHHLVAMIVGELGDPHPDVRCRNQVPFRLQLQDRLTDGRRADPEVIGHLLLAHSAPRLEVTGHDHLPQPLRGVLLLRDHIRTDDGFEQGRLRRRTETTCWHRMGSQAYACICYIIYCRPPEGTTWDDSTTRSRS